MGKWCLQFFLVVYLHEIFSLADSQVNESCSLGYLFLSVLFRQLIFIIRERKVIEVKLSKDEELKQSETKIKPSKTKTGNN